MTVYNEFDTVFLNCGFLMLSEWIMANIFMNMI